MLGLRPPGLEFRILCLEDSVISIISPSSGGSPGPVQPICAQRWPKARFISFPFITREGFCQVKKFQKSEKNLEVGGWVKSQLLKFCVFFSCFQKNWIGGGVRQIQVFLGFFLT